MRRQILWAAVFATVVLIGALWAATLRWQYSVTRKVSSEEETVASRGVDLPTIGESLGKSWSEAGSLFRKGLKKLLLPEE